MLRKIKIIDGQADKLVSVWAWVVGNFAIHKEYIGGGRFTRADFWTVTHTPIGCVIANDTYHLLRGQIPAVLEKARTASWRGVSPYDIPVCELVNVIPVIVAEKGLNPGYAEHTVALLNDLYCQGGQPETTP